MRESRCREAELGVISGEEQKGREEEMRKYSEGCEYEHGMMMYESITMKPNIYHNKN